MFAVAGGDAGNEDEGFKGEGGTADVDLDGDGCFNECEAQAGLLRRADFFV